MSTAHWMICLSIAAALAGCQAPKSDRPVPPVRQSQPARGEPQTPEQARVLIAANAKLARERMRAMTFEQFEATIYREPTELGGKYILNGDTPFLDEKQLREFFEKEVQAEPPTRSMQDAAALTISTTGGQDDLWSSAMQRSLTYCVSSQFGSRYNAVVTAMQDATGAWEHAADVKFMHVPGEDATCTASNTHVVFDVRPVNANGQYLARAFFPNEPRAACNVLIDNSAFSIGNANLTLTGILRHELGHVLGFRHEHTRPESGTCFEDSNWRPVTDYDALSVMHYPQCNGLGDWTLTLTALDQNGAACVYGPAAGFVMDPALHLQNCRTAPNAPCSMRSEVVQGSVAKNEEKIFGPYRVGELTHFEVKMTGTGDPDLYLRWDQPPTPQFYDCRPYLSSATEACSLDVPAGETKAFVMVRGYAAGSFSLAISYTTGAP